MKSRLKTGAAALTVAGTMAFSIVSAWEGIRLHAYQDVIGVWTACRGETKNIRPGMKFTLEQCDEMFIESLVEHEQGMRKCMKDPDAVPEKVYVAFLSLTYNIGTGAFCKSTLARLANAGDYRAACNQLPKWNRAGGRVLRGLTNRRLDEQRLCLEGL